MEGSRCSPSGRSRTGSARSRSCCAGSASARSPWATISTRRSSSASHGPSTATSRSSPGARSSAPRSRRCGARCPSRARLRTAGRAWRRGEARTTWWPPCPSAPTATARRSSSSCCTRSPARWAARIGPSPSPSPSAASSRSRRAGWRTSRSVVQPLDRFVGFVRRVAATGDHAGRFDRPSGCLEVDTLSETFDQLLDSLLAHEKRLRDGAREELDRLDRLKESEKLAALGRMLSGAAHEINNPLTGVLGNVELLLRTQDVTDGVRERLARSEKDGRRVSAPVRNLLKISPRDSGARGPVDVHAALREAVDVRRHDFAVAGMTLSLELHPGDVRVHGSELEIEQVFLNVINNAYDALRGGAAPTLRASTVVDGGRLTIRFDDNGPG